MVYSSSWIKICKKMIFSWEVNEIQRKCPNIYNEDIRIFCLRGWFYRIQLDVVLLMLDIDNNLHWFYDDCKWMHNVFRGMLFRLIWYTLHSGFLNIIWDIACIAVINAETVITNQWSMIWVKRSWSWVSLKRSYLFFLPLCQVDIESAYHTYQSVHLRWNLSRPSWVPSLFHA